MQGLHQRATAQRCRDGPRARGGQGPLQAEQLGIPRGILHALAPAQRQAVRVNSLAVQVAAQGLQHRLQWSGRKGVVSTAGWGCGVLAGHPMHAVKRLSPIVIRGQVGVAQPPVRRAALLHRHTLEFRLAQPLQHRRPDLGVATAGIHHLGVEGITVAAEPGRFGVVALLAEQVDIGHVLIQERQPVTALQHKHPPARLGQFGRQGAASSPAADHHHIVERVIDDHENRLRNAATRKSRQTR